MQSAFRSFKARFRCPKGHNRKAASNRLVQQLNLWGSLELHTYPDARSVVRALAPDEPVILNRPHAAMRAARFFTEKFPGTVLYAVKANPAPDLMEALWTAGVSHYDVASIAEVRLVRQVLPEAELCFMHPIKTKGAIREAYFKHGVRTFSLDTSEELEKIVEACSDLADLSATRREQAQRCLDVDAGIDAVDECRGPSCHLGPSDADAPTRQCVQAEILGDAQVWALREFLVHDADARAERVVDRAELELSAVDQNRARVGPNQARDGLAERALARAVLAHQCVDPAAVERDAHVVERLRDAEAL